MSGMEYFTFPQLFGSFAEVIAGRYFWRAKDCAAKAGVVGYLFPISFAPVSGSNSCRAALFAVHGKMVPAGAVGSPSVTEKSPKRFAAVGTIAFVLPCFFE